MAGTNGKSEPLDLTRDQIAEILESEARRRLSMSATEMVRHYRSGELPDVGGISDLLMLASLLSDDDELFVQLAA
jgi:hypothetical protein